MAKRKTKAAKEVPNPAQEFALAAARIAVDRHCKDVMVLDLRGLSPATDYFVIGTSTSPRQAKTVADEVSQYGRPRGFQRFGLAGYDTGRWILLDFVDVVVHVFDAELREYYALEMLWGDAKRVELP